MSVSYKNCILVVGVDGKQAVDVFWSMTVNNCKIKQDSSQHTVYLNMILERSSGEHAMS